MSQFPAGTEVGRHEIVRHLASGGMAELYLARVRGGLAGFDKLVVLKCIAPHLADREDFVSMFLDEARMAAVLDHPNIVQVHDIGVHEGNWYFTMEYVRGCTVRDLLARLRARGERMPLAVAVAITQGILLALHAAHSARKDGKAFGLVHRDVSPSNVIVGTNGTVKLIDFGIAKANARQTQTLSGIVKGKYAYMSPEQCRGQKLDRRSDIFSTGILLFELVTGVRLFDDPNEYLVMQKLLSGDVPRPAALRPDVPPALAAIIERALAPSPDDRFATAELMYRALARLESEHGMATLQFDVAAFVRSVDPEDAALDADLEHPTATHRKRRPRDSTESILRTLRDRFVTLPLSGRARTQQLPMQMRFPAGRQIPDGLAQATMTSGCYSTFEVVTAAAEPPEPSAPIALGSSSFATIELAADPPAAPPLPLVAAESAVAEVARPPGDLDETPSEPTACQTTHRASRRAWWFAILVVIALGASLAAVAYDTHKATTVATPQHR